MRMPPLLADFIYSSDCKLICEKSLTLPHLTGVRQNAVAFTAPAHGRETCPFPVGTAARRFCGAVPLLSNPPAWISWQACPSAFRRPAGRFPAAMPSGLSPENCPHCGQKWTAGRTKASGGPLLLSPPYRAKIPPWAVSASHRGLLPPQGHLADHVVVGAHSASQRPKKGTRSVMAAAPCLGYLALPDCSPGYFVVAPAERSDLVPKQIAAPAASQGGATISRSHFLSCLLLLLPTLYSLRLFF